MARDKHAQAVDDLVEGFSAELKAIVEKARRAVVAWLSSTVSVEDGMVKRTKSNQAVLRSIAARFSRAMDRAGYSTLVRAYVAEFNGQFVFFDDVLKKIGDDIGQDLAINFGERDIQFFASQQMSISHALDSVVTAAALAAQRQAIMSVGGMKLADLIDAIVTQFDKTTGEATTLADTAVSTFYRTMADRGYQKVESTLPASIVPHYRYAGPDDRVTRPFCHVLTTQSAVGRLWTRAEIDEMDNGQMPGVFTSCGGFNCRHQWLLVLQVKK